MSSEQCVVDVFLLAENRLLRDVLARLLASKNDVQIVGTAALSSQIVFEVIAANPDVILCDSLATAISPEGIITELRRNLPNVKLLMFGMDCDEEKFLIAVQHGVTGYVLKDASAAEVASAIRSVANGESICPAKLCRVLFDFVARSRAWQPGAQVRKNLGLTRREQQLVQLVSEGLTNKEIAARLYLSEQTIKNHLRRMLRKAGATNRLDAVERWRAQGFWI